jgi:hypothetical protein
VNTSAAIIPPILNFNESFIYDLPSSFDPEGLDYKTTIKSGPPFVSLVLNNEKLTLHPLNCATDFADFTVEIELTDG